MFTTEFDYDEILITLLDDDDNYEDISVYIYDELIYIRQWNELIDNYTEIAMSPQMFEELMQAMKLPEGAYIMRGKNGN